MIIKELVEAFDGQSDERRAGDRSAMGDNLKVVADHMFQIKRALDAGKVGRAQALVDGAIRAFQKQQQEI